MPRNASRPPALLGIDLGTSSVKVVVLDLDGKLLASTSAGYPVLADGGVLSLDRGAQPACDADDLADDDQGGRGQARGELRQLVEAPCD